MKPLLVGESNPYQRDEADAMRYALYPEPAGRADASAVRRMHER